MKQFSQFFWFWDEPKKNKRRQWIHDIFQNRNKWALPCINSRTAYERLTIFFQVRNTFIRPICLSLPSESIKKILFPDFLFSEGIKRIIGQKWVSKCNIGFITFYVNFLYLPFYINIGGNKRTTNLNKPAAKSSQSDQVCTTFCYHQAWMD